MDTLLEKAPYLASLLLLVGMFLAYQVKRDKAMESVSEKCHQNQRDCAQQTAEAFKETTESVKTTGKETIEALGEVRVALAKLNGRN